MLDRVDVVQPVLFAVMVSLAEMLGGYGVVAGCGDWAFPGRDRRGVCGWGVLLAEAARVVALRSQALARLSGSGAMASVLLGARCAPRLQR